MPAARKRARADADAPAPPAPPALRAAVRAGIARLAAARAARGASFCPSEVARALRHGDAAWRALMPLVRAEAAAMIAGGARLGAAQRGVALRGSLLDARGPIRLRATAP